MIFSVSRFKPNGMNALFQRGNGTREGTDEVGLRKVSNRGQQHLVLIDLHLLHGIVDDRLYLKGRFRDDLVFLSVANGNACDFRGMHGDLDWFSRSQRMTPIQIDRRCKAKRFDLIFAGEFADIREQLLLRIADSRLRIENAAAVRSRHADAEIKLIRVANLDIEGVSGHKAVGGGGRFNAQGAFRAVYVEKLRIALLPIALSGGDDLHAVLSFCQQAASRNFKRAFRRFLPTEDDAAAVQVDHILIRVSDRIPGKSYGCAANDLGRDLELRRFQHSLRFDGQSLRSANGAPASIQISLEGDLPDSALRENTRKFRFSVIQREFIIGDAVHDQPGARCFRRNDSEQNRLAGIKPVIFHGKGNLAAAVAHQLRRHRRKGRILIGAEVDLICGKLIIRRLINGPPHFIDSRQLDPPFTVISGRGPRQRFQRLRIDDPHRNAGNANAVFRCHASAHGNIRRFQQAAIQRLHGGIRILYTADQLRDAKAIPALAERDQIIVPRLCGRIAPYAVFIRNDGHRLLLIVSIQVQTNRHA